MRFVVNAVGFGLLTLFWSLVGMIALPFSQRFVLGFVAPSWGRSILWLCGIEVEAVGLDRPLDAPAYLVMGNHSSHLDACVIYSRLPIVMRPVAKRELGYIPIFGWLLWMGAAIMIDRGARERAVRSIQRAGAAIRGGRSVLMFPEGTRTPPGVLGEFKKGPFHLATEAQVPVLPVGLTGTGELLRPGDWRIRRGRVLIRVGTPIETAGRGQSDAARERLAEDVRRALKGLMEPGNTA